MGSVKADIPLMIHKRSKFGLEIPAAANVSSSVDRTPDDADAHAPPPMSMDQIKATEMIQRIHKDARQLLQNIQGLAETTFPKAGYECNDVPEEITSNARLLAAQHLSKNIADNLDDLALLSYRSATDAEQRQTVVGPKACENTGRKRRASKLAAFDRTLKVRLDDSLCCHVCQATSTPEWRDGPDGRWTLCNVCGLLYAHRLRKSGPSIRGVMSPG
ncbi:GATA zinc finger [Colletotrichum orchidophilum]|uniref:GATA zinc finger n=1 Tax=Colletotrichum orchidophilum TaxID=1209926 RepID=A0A1G4ATJ6_9PEZI|nr:GATA zinc finger [Colletotrichum orchidophilum]OHE92484.1 GATA zinc finger [Colletotrichum orchidophilum]